MTVILINHVFAVYYLQKHKGISPSVNPSVTRAKGSMCKGQHDTATMAQGRVFTFYEDPCVCQSSQITCCSPTGLCWGAQRKFLCLFRRTKSAILWNVHSPQNEEPFCSANNKFGKRSWESIRVFPEDHAGNLSHEQGGVRKHNLSIYILPVIPEVKTESQFDKRL